MLPFAQSDIRRSIVCSDKPHHYDPLRNYTHGAYQSYARLCLRFKWHVGFHFHIDDMQSDSWIASMKDDVLSPKMLVLKKAVFDFTCHT